MTARPSSSGSLPKDRIAYPPRTNELFGFAVEVWRRRLNPGPTSGLYRHAMNSGFGARDLGFQHPGCRAWLFPFWLCIDGYLNLDLGKEGFMKAMLKTGMDVLAVLWGRGWGTVMPSTRRYIWANSGRDLTSLERQQLSRNVPKTLRLASRDSVECISQLHR